MLRHRYWFVLLLFVLVGCSGAKETPQLIASYPGEKQIAAHPINPSSMNVIYTASIELEVSNMDRAVQDAEELAYQYGGYLVNSQSWIQNDQKYTTLIFAVPIYNFETVHRSLLRLGSLVNENVTGEIHPKDDSWQSFSHITLRLRPKKSILPRITWPNWRPAQTFAKAWDVFTAIFGFILDIAIWISVVIGPFVLIGWGVKKLVLWKKKKG